MRLLSLTSIRRARRHLLATGIVLSSLGGLSLLGGPSVAFAQVPGEPAPASRSTDKRPVLDTTLIGQDNRVEAAGSVDKALLDKFQKLLTGAKMNGMFTVDGRPMDKLSAEQYAIEKVEKQPDGDWWLITARITYGEKDFSLPVPVEVKWAGTTPVITLDKVTLPGYGTFSARVVFHGDRYAGTWQHDDKGGHLFGKIELAKQ